MSNSPIPLTDPALFLEIAGEGAAVSTHAELWRWLQGRVQRCLAHEIMLIGWGDFRSGDLSFDVVSSLPGVRSSNFTSSMVKPMLSYLRDCWAAAQHLPCQLDLATCAGLIGASAHNSSAGRALASMRTAVVHGTGERGRGCERVFAALSSRSGGALGNAAALKLLVPFIDTALRQMPPVPSPQPASGRKTAETLESRLEALSERERQIMVWVALGKTNPEIGCILHISEFTVKNHMKSIFSKLDVTNRAQAVSKLTRVTSYA
jgi:transcriptional regulator EpsA